MSARNAWVAVHDALVDADEAPDLDRFDHGEAAYAVLAVLGIDVEASTDDVKAALALGVALATIQKHRPRGFAIEFDGGEPEVGLHAGYCAMADLAITGGKSMAVAVVALASVLAENAEVAS